MNADDTAVIADMERDARRYRWLRRFHGPAPVYVIAEDAERGDTCLFDTDLDAVIDAAIAVEKLA